MTSSLFHYGETLRGQWVPVLLFSGIASGIGLRRQGPDFDKATGH